MSGKKKDYMVEFDLGITVFVENAESEDEAYELAEDELPAGFGQYIFEARTQAVDAPGRDTALRHADFKVLDE